MTRKFILGVLSLIIVVLACSCEPAGQGDLLLSHIETDNQYKAYTISKEELVGTWDYSLWVEYDPGRPYSYRPSKMISSISEGDGESITFLPNGTFFESYAHYDSVGGDNRIIFDGRVGEWHYYEGEGLLLLVVYREGGERLYYDYLVHYFPEDGRIELEFTNDLGDRCAQVENIFGEQGCWARRYYRKDIGN